MMSTSRYWLFKSEPDVFSIDDLKSVPGGREVWDGVRNYQARNRLRDDVQVGDEVLFYHSSAQPSGIAGIMTVVAAGYPDPTQFDPNSKYHDPKSDLDNPRWIAVDVSFERKFPRLIPLTELKSTPGLEDMAVVQRGQRLSILPVTAAEWKIVMQLAKKKPTAAN